MLSSISESKQHRYSASVMTDYSQKKLSSNFLLSKVNEVNKKVEITGNFKQTKDKENCFKTF